MVKKTSKPYLALQKLLSNTKLRPLVVSAQSKGSKSVKSENSLKNSVQSKGPKYTKPLSTGSNHTRRFVEEFVVMFPNTSIISPPES